MDNNNRRGRILKAITVQEYEHELHKARSQGRILKPGQLLSEIAGVPYYSEEESTSDDEDYTSDDEEARTEEGMQAREASVSVPVMKNEKQEKSNRKRKERQIPPPHSESKSEIPEDQPEKRAKTDV
jgi:hypothetical protein